MERSIRRPVIQILQSRETYDNLAPEFVRGGTVQLDPQDAFSDPLISQIALTIANEIEDGFADGILVDALNTALAVQIMRRFTDPSAIMLAPSNGLSRDRLKRVRDYVETHLDDRLTLTDLAGVACLSPYHFSRPSRSRSALVRSAMSCSVASSGRKL
jgi:AraC family transcriptional regulator